MACPAVVVRTPFPQLSTSFLQVLRTPGPKFLCPVCMDFAAHRIVETFYGYALQECSGCRLNSGIHAKCPMPAGIPRCTASVTKRCAAVAAHAHGANAGAGETRGLFSGSFGRIAICKIPQIGRSVSVSSGPQAGLSQCGRLPLAPRVSQTCSSAFLSILTITSG